MFRVLRKLFLTILMVVYASQASAMFIQPDWYDPSDPRVGTNRYAYSFNDPINNSDPGGNCPSCAGGIIGGVIGGLAQGAVDLYNGELSSARAYGAAIAGGAVAGATFGLGTTATLGGLAAKGAASSIAGTTTGSLVEDGTLPTPQEVAISGVVGAVTGPIGNRASALNSSNPIGYMQTSYREQFSKIGQGIYSDIAGSPINSIDDLADAIRSGQVSAKDISVDYVTRNGTRVLADTRTSVALQRAGVPQKDWNMIDKTGDALTEGRVSDAMARNGLDEPARSLDEPTR